MTERRSPRTYQLLCQLTSAFTSAHGEAFDELEEHQAYGDSTLGYNERSGRARGAARRGASALECRCNLTASPTLSLLLSNKPPLHYLTTFIFASAHLLSTFPHVHQIQFYYRLD